MMTIFKCWSQKDYIQLFLKEGKELRVTSQTDYLGQKLKE